jgi:hypothetical protein
MSETTPSDRAAINRENSLKSTGPKTSAGKQTSSLNALRHGLTGQVVVMPSEDLAAYQRFTQNFHDDFKPSGAMETQLVQSIADDNWRLNRARALENNLFTLGAYLKTTVDTEHPEVRDALAMAEALREQTKALSTLSLHQNRIARTIERTLKLLREIQAERLAKESSELAKAGHVFLLQSHYNQCAGKTEPYDPAADGFVFTAAQIEEHLRRSQLVHDAFSSSLRYESAA